MSKKAIEIKAPNYPDINGEYFNVFLAGSIEQGKAEDWQKRIVEAMADEPIKFLNPRREAWDPTWEQSIKNPQFCEQVLWELNNLDSADAIVIYIDPNTLSPVTLIEFGLHVRSGKLIVYCPDGFWRKGNIDITCRNYGAEQVETFEELISAINEKKRKRTQA